jgi:hypothetical protein
MKRLDVDEVLLPCLDDAGPEGEADGVAEFDRREAELPNFLEHRVAVLMPVGIPAGGEGQGLHLVRLAYHNKRKFALHQNQSLLKLP